MDYEKKYKEALERAKGIINYYKERNRDESAIEDLQEIFPELKENEGERIKNLIYCLIRDRSDNGKLLEHNGVTVKEALAWIEKQGSPVLSNYSNIGKNVPAEWSAEDEQNLNATLGYIDDEYLRRWLKDIIHAQYDSKNIEWSEEDERERKRVVGLLEGWLSTFKETCYAEDCKCGIDWLNSLRPQKQWKPSDEQMSALQRCVEYLDESDNEDYGIIESLCNDLSKL